MQEYLGYIDQLTKGQAGKLVASAGETTATVRRRIGAAARAAGHKADNQAELKMRSTSGWRGVGQETGGAKGAEEVPRSRLRLRPHTYGTYSGQRDCHPISVFPCDPASFANKESPRPRLSQLRRGSFLLGQVKESQVSL